MRILLVTGRLVASRFDTVWRNFPSSTRNLVPSTRHYSASGTSNKDEAEGRTPGGPGTKATEQQLIEIKEKMLEAVSHFFSQSHAFDLYHPNVQFEDNIRNIRTSGLFNFYLQVLQVRVFCMCRYTTSSVTVLKATHDTQDSKVCIRWTFSGNFFLRSWLSLRSKGLDVRPSRTLDGYFRTLDGFSIMYVGADGRIWKHVIEKMIPDTDSVLRDESSKPLISTEIRGSLAVSPKS